MEMFAEAGDGKETLDALKARHHPDIVLMDVSLKTVSGFDVMKSMHSFDACILWAIPFDT